MKQKPAFATSYRKLDALALPAWLSSGQRAHFHGVLSLGAWLDVLSGPQSGIEGA